MYNPGIKIPANNLTAALLAGRALLAACPAENMPWLAAVPWRVHAMQSGHCGMPCEDVVCGGCTDSVPERRRLVHDDDPDASTFCQNPAVQAVMCALDRSSDGMARKPDTTRK